MQTIDIARAQRDEINSVEAFYREWGYQGGVSEQDITLIARCEEKLIGVVRLCPENDVLVLRGMRVNGAYQRQRVGSELLLHCVPYLDQSLSFCLPYAHLTAFYQRIGFVVSNVAEIPTFLANRLRDYNQEGKGVLVMQRSPHIETNN